MRFSTDESFCLSFFVIYEKQRCRIIQEKYAKRMQSIAQSQKKMRIFAMSKCFVRRLFGSCEKPVAIEKYEIVIWTIFRIKTK